MYLGRAHRHNMVESSLNDLFLKLSAEWTASNEICREDQIVTLIVIMIPYLKKKTIDLRANVTVPGPVERQHD